MVTPIQLLLFGCRRGVWKPEPSATESAGPESEGIVLLDDWLPFRMRYSTAARILALRPALEALLVRVCLRPDTLENLSYEDNCVIELTKELCRQTAGIAGSIREVSDAAVYSDRPLLTGLQRQVGQLSEKGIVNCERNETTDRVGIGGCRRRYHEQWNGLNCASSSRWEHVFSS